MDGVLVDSEDISIQVGIGYFSSIGRTATKENFMNHLGTGHLDFFRGPASEMGLSDDEWSIDDADAYFAEHFPEMVKGKEMAMPGAKEIVRNAKKAGLLLAVCSSASDWKVESNIRSLGFEPSDFDCVISGPAPPPPSASTGRISCPSGTSWAKSPPWAWPPSL